jgi:hypothetical protein
MTVIPDDIEAECETELARLGSEKLLLAATEADIRADTVAGAVAGTAGAAAEALEAWATSADDGDAAAMLTEAAAEYRSVREATLEAWPDAAGDAVLELPAADGDWHRVGAGLVGVGLVLDRLLLQAISFHVNEANTGAADRLREVRADVAQLVDRPGSAAGGEDAVVAGAVAAVESAYDRYATRLDAMGLDPKPLC